jgi:copper resistance protein C
MNVPSKSNFFQLAILSLGLLCQTANAEGVLIKGIPEDNAQLKQFDGKINLWFSGNVGDRYPSIVVVNSQGQRVDNRVVQLEIADRSQLRVSTKPLTTDHYVMRYRVVTEDGLVVSGIRKFAIIP